MPVCGGNAWSAEASDVAEGVAGVGGVSYWIELQVDNTLGTYTARARPQDGQAADASGDFMLDHQGVQAVTGSAAHCW